MKENMQSSIAQNRVNYSNGTAKLAAFIQSNDFSKLLVEINNDPKLLNGYIVTSYNGNMQELNSDTHNGTLNDLLIINSNSISINSDVSVTVVSSAIEYALEHKALECYQLFKDKGASLDYNPIPNHSDKTARNQDVLSAMLYGANVHNAYKYEPLVKEFVAEFPNYIKKEHLELSKEPLHPRLANTESAIAWSNIKSTIQNQYLQNRLNDKQAKQQNIASALKIKM